MRGRAYAYNFENCNWRGILGDGLVHVTHTHLELAPYHCIPCGYKAATEGEIKRHVEKSQHSKKADNFTGTVVAYHSGINVAGHLTKLSADESQ